MKVLVVEDDPSTQVLVRTVLQSLGYEVTHVTATALDALRAAENNPPDLLLVDVEIEGAMDGIETAEVFADRFAIPVVYMTTHADAATLERAKLTSPSGYILKPVDEPRLSTALEMALMRHRMERELEEREVWIRTLLSCLGEGVIATDPAGRVRYLNPAAAELLGCEVDVALGKPIAEVFRVTPGVPGQSLEDPITQVLRSGAAVPEQLTQVMAGTRVRTVEVSGRPIRDGRVATLGAALVFRDVAERVRADETMRRAAKMQAVGTLASGVAHHFNNALQIMLGHAELIASVVDRTDPIAQSAEAIRRTGRRSTELVRQLLAFSHTDRLVPDNLDVRELVDELAALIRTVLPAHIRFHPPLVVPETFIEVGRKELEQALLALVDNAKDAMPQGGELRLEVSRRTRAGGERGRIHAEVVFAIIDTGKGVTPEVRAHLFEPFFTTKEPGQGTGLGLSSVFMAAQRHGGSVEVDSELGRGATFRIVVPESEPASARPKAALANPVSSTDRAVQMARGDETVLLVEDEDDVRALIATALKNLGYTVLEAPDAEQALELAESHAGVIHLVLTDLVMPGLNGYELAARVEKARPGVRVLFMSAYDEEFTQLYLAPNTTTPLHLKKPFRIETLAWKVRRAVSG